MDRIDGLDIVYREEARRLLDTNRIHALVDNLLTGVFVETPHPSSKGMVDSREAVLQRIMLSIEEYAQASQAVLAVINGEVAGMAAYDQIGLVPEDGRKAYEIQRISVLPNFRRGKVFPHPAQETFDLVRSLDPEAAIFLHTKHPKVREWGWSQQFQLSSHERYGEISGMSDEEIQQWKEFELPYGWGVYEMDPLKDKSKDIKQ